MDAVQRDPPSLGGEVMPPKNKKRSKVEGLFKRCKHTEWNACARPWWGRFRGERVPLAGWSRSAINSKDAAKAVLSRMQSAVRTGKFDRRGEHVGFIAATTSFSVFLDDYIKRHVEERKLRSTSLRPCLELFRERFGAERMDLLATNSYEVETWLQDLRVERKWENSTYNRMFEAGRAAFNWAKRRKLITESPFDGLSKLQENNKRDTRITLVQEEALFAACDTLNDLPPSKQTRLTFDIATAIRQRAAAGEMQKSIAADLGLSRGLVSDIVTGKAWNPSIRRRTASQEMRRRLIAALDLGLRAGEMLAVQVKHVDFDAWEIQLPAAITKAKRDQVVHVGTGRLRDVLNQRRVLGPNAYVFGRENGGYVADFDRAWNTLFKAAKVPVGRRDGRVWHDLRHEFCSNLMDKGATVAEVREMARHADITTTQRYLTARQERLKELATFTDRRSA